MALRTLTMLQLTSVEGELNIGMVYEDGGNNPSRARAREFRWSNSTPWSWDVSYRNDVMGESGTRRVAPNGGAVETISIPASWDVEPDYFNITGALRVI